MPLVLSQTVAPTAEPITRAEAKAHLNIASAITADDTLIDSLIITAREFVEGFTWRQLVTATYAWNIDAFADVLRIPRPPVQSVTSIAYLDTAGASQTLASSVYTLDAVAEPGRLFLAYGKAWPSVRAVRNAITITFVAGYGAASTVPEKFKHAMKLTVHDLYEHRGSKSEVNLNDNDALMRLLWLDRMAA